MWIKSRQLAEKGKVEFHAQEGRDELCALGYRFAIVGCRGTNES